MAESNVKGKPKKRWFGDFRAYEGKTLNWTNRKTKDGRERGVSGWKYEGGKWVQYNNGVKTGRTSKTRLGTTTISAHNPTQTEKGRLKIAARDADKNKNKNNTSQGGNAANASTKKPTPNKLTDKDREDIRKEKETTKMLTSSGRFKEVDAPGKNNKGKKVLQRVDEPKSETPKKKKKMSALERRNREIHGDEAIDKLKDKHADFKKHRKAGTLKEFAKKYPNSQTAKRLRKNETPGQRKKRLKKNTEVPKKTTSKKTNPANVLAGKSLEERKKISQAALKALEDK